MVDLFTGGMILPLMLVNAAATCYLLSLTAPLAFMEAWKKALETTDGARTNPSNRSASSNAPISTASSQNGCSSISTARTCPMRRSS
jgi:hypothetical protein